MLLEKFKAQKASLVCRETMSCEEEGFSGSGDVFKVCFDIKDTTISYKVGDSLGVFPKNSHHVVETLLSFLGYSPQHLVQTRASSQTTIYEFLRSHANLDKISPKLKCFFPELDETLSLYDAVQRYKPSIPIEAFVQGVLPLLPRFYSIASAPDAKDGYIELLVRLVSYPGAYEQRFGVCSFFLCKELELENSCHVFVQPTKHFTLSPETSGKPIVMIGSGTGIAPYKGFVQQRLSQQDTGENILFFGERFERANFYYQDFWKHAVENKHLQLFLAFSRDGHEKVYVQDVLKKQSDLVQKAYENGGFFFVCGSKVLGGEVKKVLEDILGKETLLKLREERRYVIDVY